MTTTTEAELLGVVLTPRQIWELLDLVNDTPGDADEEVLDAVASKLRSPRVFTRTSACSLPGPAARPHHRGARGPRRPRRGRRHPARRRDHVRRRPPRGPGARPGQGRPRPRLTRRPDRRRHTSGDHDRSGPQGARPRHGAGAVEAINAGDAAGQMAHYTDDLVLEFPFADPPKRLESKAVVEPYLTTALGLFTPRPADRRGARDHRPRRADRRGRGHRYVHPQRRAVREPLRDRLRLPRRPHLPPARVLQPTRRPAFRRRYLTTRPKVRRSSTNCSGRSKAAKCPPRGCSTQCTIRYRFSAHARGVCISSNGWCDVAGRHVDAAGPRLVGRRPGQARLGVEAGGGAGGVGHPVGHDVVEQPVPAEGRVEAAVVEVAPDVELLEDPGGETRPVSR